MNGIGAFSKLLSGVSKSLKIINEVIPIYKETKPFFNNVKNVVNSFKKKDSKQLDNNYIEKKVIIKSDNNPQFFI